MMQVHIQGNPGKPLDLQEEAEECYNLSSDSGVGIHRRIAKDMGEAIKEKSNGGKLEGKIGR